MTEPSDELRQLVSGLTDWAKKSLGEVRQTAGGTAGTDCEWCPICQAAAAVRGENPELGEKLRQAGAAFVDVVKAFVDTAAQPAPAKRPSPAPAPKVERIELDDSE